jgi:hypothetical protein
MFNSTGCSFVGVWKRSTRVDSEPHFPGELKAIRDKMERFLGLRGSMGVVRITSVVPSREHGRGGTMSSSRSSPQRRVRVWRGPDYDDVGGMSV